MQMRYLRKIIAVGSIMLVFGSLGVHVNASSENSKEEFSGFKFEVEDVTSETGEYLALTDRYGIQIFSEEFNNKIVGYHEKQEKQVEAIFQEVLTDEKKQNSYDTIFLKVIKTENENRYNKDFTVQEPSSENRMWWVFILIGIVGVSMMGIIMIPRKGRKEDENNYKSYVLQE